MFLLFCCDYSVLGGVELQCRTDGTGAVISISTDIARNDDLTYAFQRVGEIQMVNIFFNTKHPNPDSPTTRRIKSEKEKISNNNLFCYRNDFNIDDSISSMDLIIKNLNKMKDLHYAYLSFKEKGLYLPNVGCVAICNPAVKAFYALNVNLGREMFLALGALAGIGRFGILMLNAANNHPLSDSINDSVLEEFLKNISGNKSRNTSIELCLDYAFFQKPPHQFLEEMLMPENIKISIRAMR